MAIYNTTPPHAKGWDGTITYQPGDFCYYNGYWWHNTSGTTSIGIEPGTNYNVWNVTYSNENLLDNWYFKNPINQRGIELEQQVSDVYGIDRWSGVGNGYIKKQDGLFFKSGYGLQFIEGIKSGEYTFSAIVAPNSHISFVFGNWGGSEEAENCNSANGGVVSVTLSLNKDEEKPQFVYIGNASASMDCMIYACKLELGSVSTLANDAAPNYQQELAKCQRYFYAPTPGYEGNSLVASSDGIDFFFNGAIRFPVPMRTRPAITGLQVRMRDNSTGDIITINEFIGLFMDNEGLNDLWRVTLDTNSTIVANHRYAFMDKLMFSADF